MSKKKELNIPLISRIRSQYGLGQKDFAKKLDVCQSRICKLEKGELRLERDILLPLHRVFKVTPEEIFDALKRGE